VLFRSFKEFNADSKQCRRTTLAPTFGGPPNRIVLMPLDASDDTNSKSRYYAYSTAERVVGLGCLPLTGNPSKVMGLVAHPSKISGLAVSFDGLFLFTAGGSDLTVNMWTVDTYALSPPVNVSEMKNKSEPLEPFLELLEGGSGGEMHNDIIEYFYFCQLRNQGENSMEDRKITGKIPLDEIPSLMRAVGYYPTEEEVTNMINEVRYGDFMITGETYNFINLNETIRLYLNHRPAVALNTGHIEAAFNQISKSLNGPNSTDAVSWQELKRLLMSDGEAVSPADLDVCMQALIGSNANVLDGQMISAARLAEEILGFDYSSSET